MHDQSTHQVRAAKRVSVLAGIVQSTQADVDRCFTIPLPFDDQMSLALTYYSIGYSRLITAAGVLDREPAAVPVQSGYTVRIDLGARK